MIPSHQSRWGRRAFIKTGIFGAAALSCRGLYGEPSFNIKTSKNKVRPNFIFLHVDQLGEDKLSATGCPDIFTPCMDGVIHGGHSFRNTYSANPVCGPSRAAWFTSRLPSETGCLINGAPILRPDIPDMGQWMGRAGYETMHCGKWHFTGREVTESFRFCPHGSSKGEINDPMCARTVAGYLKSRGGSDPFLLSVGMINPHDICEWWGAPNHVPVHPFPHPEILDTLPELPKNYHQLPDREPGKIRSAYRPGQRHEAWTDEWWRYYIWTYHRYVEMVDACVGRVVNALAASPYADNTFLIFTSDHGEGAGRHRTTGKQFLYEEAARVPFSIVHPHEVRAGRRDETALISLTDIFPTICDYAGVKPPEVIRGRSLRPLLQGDAEPWRDFVRVETLGNGRMLRTADYKYIEYLGDPAIQLFDLRHDPDEIVNLAFDARHAGVLAEHQKTLREYDATLDVAKVVDPKVIKKIAKGGGEE